MKMIIILSMIILSGLQAQINTQKYEVGHKYSISVPYNMLRTYDLTDVGKLQFQNKAKNLYLIVVDESKEALHALGIPCNDVYEYYEIITEDYEKKYKNYEEINKKTIESNGYKILQTEYKYTEGDSTDSTVVYFCQDYLETEKYFYKVASFTIQENIIKLGDGMREISKSIKED